MPIVSGSVSAAFPIARDERGATHLASVAADTAAGLRYTLAVDGLDDDQRVVLRSILKVLDARTDVRWCWSEDPEPDLHLHTRDSGARRDARLQAVLVGEDDPDDDTGVLRLQAPLRVMAVLELLEAAAQRLAPSAPAARVAAAVPAEAATSSDDGLSLASALVRRVERRNTQTLRVRLVGFGSLYVCPQRRVFCIDFARERLAEAIAQHRFVITVLAPDSPELLARIDQAEPLDTLLWSLGLVTVWERADLEDSSFQLLRWPDLVRLPHRVEHLQVCAALAARPCTLSELQARSGLSRGDTLHLLHACALCGLIQVMPGVVSAAPSGTAAGPGREAPIAGLLHRLWRRFGR